MFILTTSVTPFHSQAACVPIRGSYISYRSPICVDFKYSEFGHGIKVENILKEWRPGRMLLRSGKANRIRLWIWRRYDFIHKSLKESQDLYAINQENNKDNNHLK